MIRDSGFPTFMPVMNVLQRLIAIQPDFGTLPTNQLIEILQSWKESEFFEKLSQNLWLVSFPDPQLIPADLHTRLPANRICLLIPEAACANKENQSRLKHFSTNGFRIVADNFVSSLELAWIDTKYFAMDAKVGLPFYAKSWTNKLSSGQHWAKNISDSVVLEQALQSGFKMLSGDYAFNPPVSNKSADSSARTRLLKLLGLVSRDADSPELEELFKQDPSLSFMLFKLVSSAAFAQTVRVSSFGQAITLLGRRQLQRWLQLLLYARPQENAGALNPLMTRAAFRASMMEGLCQKHGGNKDEQDAAFMVGIFSLLDKLFGSNLSEVLQPLTLKEEILDALLRRTGRLGTLLHVVELSDRAYSAEVEIALKRAEINVGVFEECLVNAYAWVNQVCRDA
ncbi:EAL and HDOD domain-containing protein [Undibacterium sp. Ji67W]|uniref:EAL and HDOD domain-containing protein n=1 Tax=Undibacterium sp. Ji67W TaxID=3413042 RepID=UPI003BF3F70F